MGWKRQKNVDKLTVGAINFYYRAYSLAPSDNHEVTVDSLYTLSVHTVVLDNWRSSLHRYNEVFIDRTRMIFAMFR